MLNRNLQEGETSLILYECLFMPLLCDFLELVLSCQISRKLDGWKHAAPQIHSRKSLFFMRKRQFAHILQYFCLRLRSKPWWVQLVLEFIQKQWKHDIILHQGMKQCGNSPATAKGSVCGQVMQEKELESKLFYKLYFSLLK